MKIAFIIRTFPNLSNTFILNQITGLIERGHDVDIYAIYGNQLKPHSDYIKYNLKKKTIYPPDVPVNPVLRILKAFYLFGKNSQKIPQLIQSLNLFKYGVQAASLYLFYWTLAINKTHQYDIIHCHFGLCGLLGVDLRDLGLLNGKIITSFHGVDIYVYPRKYGKGVYKRLFKSGELYTVNSEFSKKQIIKLGCPENKIVKLYVGVDINKYKTEKNISLSQNKQIKILTVARLTEKKGLEYSIKAVDQVLKSFPNLHYNIVGEGELKASLFKLISDLGCQDKISLLGGKTQEQVYELYKQSQIFILASVTASNGDKEGQGLVIQEAQAMNLPVISTFHNGIPEGLQNGNSGFLVPERDIDALSKKLDFLLQNLDIRNIMGEKGRAYVKENYNLDDLNNKLVEIYQQVGRK